MGKRREHASSYGTLLSCCIVIKLNRCGEQPIHNTYICSKLLYVIILLLPLYFVTLLLVWITRVITTWSGVYPYLPLVTNSVVTKAVDAETETKTEAAGFETEAKTEAVYLKTEAEAQGSWPILLTVLSSGTVLAQKF